MSIDKEKCSKWCSKLIELMEITKTINNSEARYIKSNFAIERIKQYEAMKG